MKKAFLLLADGTLFEGTACGYEGQCIGEVVFNTGMIGYQEVISDPSYYGQIVTMTYPIIGSYGITAEQAAAQKSWVSGLIMRDECTYPSNWRCRCSLDELLKAQKVIGLQGIDTRRLTRLLRSKGVMNGIIYTEGFAPDEAAVAYMKDFAVKDAVKAVSRTEACVCPAEGETKYRVAMLDFGTTYGMEQALQARGCEVTLLPAHTSAQEILAGGFDGVMLSGGPGDPAENTEIIAAVGELAESGMPMFGMCLGHQLVALALGAKTQKMHFGHHGASQPVKDLDGDRTYITSQDHGYEVVRDSIDASAAHLRYANLNDGSVEGIDYIGRPIFTTQFHPELCSGPQDTSFLFDRFVRNIDSAKGGAQVCL